MLDLCGFYVLISRVREFSGLRLLQLDQNALNAIKKFQHSAHLYAWENGYDKQGNWSDELARAAFKAHCDKRKAALLIENTAKSAAKKAVAGTRAAATLAVRKTAVKRAPASPSNAPSGNPPAKKPVPARKPKAARSLPSPDKTCRVSPVKSPPRKIRNTKKPPSAPLPSNPKRERLSPFQGRPPETSPKRPALSRAARLAAERMRIVQEAEDYGVDPDEWARVLNMWASTNPQNYDSTLPGYPYFIRRYDFYSLMNGRELTTQIVDEISIRIVNDSPHVAVLGSDFLYMMAPPNEAEVPTQRLTRGIVRPQYWLKRFGPDAALGTTVEFVVAPYCVPGHWCLAVADLSSASHIYYDSAAPYGAKYQHRALAALSDYVTQVDREQQQREVDPGMPDLQRSRIYSSLFRKEELVRPRQPDGVSCGICVLAMIEVIAQGRFSEVAAANDMTAHEASCIRARFACLLLRSPPQAPAHHDDSEQRLLDLARQRAHESTEEIDAIDNS